MKDNELIFRTAQRIKKLRNEKGWTLRELEALTNIDNAYLSKLESGAINPTLVTLYKLSQAFGIKLSKLVEIE